MLLGRREKTSQARGDVVEDVAGAFPAYKRSDFGFDCRAKK
jgi:hypothetical protein